MDLFVGDTFTIVPTTVPEGLDVTFTPDNSGVVSVYEYGVVTALKEGSATVKVSVGGDGVYALNTTDVAVTVSKIPTEISVVTKTLDLNIRDEVVIGATLTPANAGNLTYTSSDERIVIVVNDMIMAVGEGNATVTVSFAGDDKYEAADSKIIDVSVSMVNTPIEIVPDSLELVVGEDASFTVVLPSDASGIVLVDVGDNKYYANVENGNATVKLVGLTAGDYTANVVFTGDDKYLNASTSIDVKVNELAKTNINIAVPEVKAGETADVIISIPGATGNATVIYDGVETVVPLDENGTVDFAIDPVGAGDHSIAVVYLGDGTHDSAVASVNFTADKEIAEVNVTVSEFTPEGANVTVSIPGATGNVSVIVDGVENVVPLENGTATYAIPEVTGGEHSVVVVYDGDDTHAGAHVAQTLYNDEFPTRFTNITVADGNLTAVLVLPSGDGLANVPVTITIDSEVVNATTDANGLLTIEDAYGRLIELKYDGNYTILPCDVAVDLTGTAPIRDSTVFVSSDFEQFACDYYEGERGGNFTFQLTDSQGKALANKIVFIGYNGVTYNRTTDENGYATVQINLKNAGLYTFVIVFLGDENYNASMAVHKITINKKPITISAAAKTYKATAKTKKYTVTLKTKKCSSVDGKTYLAKGKKVTLKINGKTYTAKTNAKGQATFSLKITKKGKFTTSIKFAGDNTYNKASKSVKITIK